MTTGITPTVFFLVLLAAVCHATWNALVKSGSDKLVLQALVIGGPGLACLPLLFFVAPPAAESWPYLLTSTLVHQLYYVVLVYAYKSGDLSQVYPISRGTAPALIALLALLLAGERLSGLEWLGLAILSVGIASISRLATVLTGLAPPRDGEMRAVALALVSALTISIYSFADGQGVRLSGSAPSYIIWLFALQGLPIGGIALWRRRGRLRQAFGPNLKTGLLGGAVATVAYAIVIWAMGVAPMAHVAALRETSVILAAAIGTMMMGEPFGGRRIAASILVLAGAALLQLGG